MHTHTQVLCLGEQLWEDGRTKEERRLVSLCNCLYSFAFFLPTAGRRPEALPAGANPPLSPLSTERLLPSSGVMRVFFSPLGEMLLSVVLLSSSA